MMDFITKNWPAFVWRVALRAAGPVAPSAREVICPVGAVREEVEDAVARAKGGRKRKQVRA